MKDGYSKIVAAEDFYVPSDNAWVAMNATILVVILIGITCLLARKK